MICLSFDTDHMNKKRMEEFFSNFSFPGHGTFFCTEPYSLRENANNHEFGPHPFLASESDWEKELRKKRDEFPEAIGWRSHSCIFSHLLAEWVGKNGYKYVSTNDQFCQDNIQPVCHPWGVWHLPIYYMDNMDFSRHKFWKNKTDKPFNQNIIKNSVEKKALFVYDFHPLHLLLNTPGPEYYFDVRDRFIQGEETNVLRYEGYGAANFFHDLCKAMEDHGMESVTMSEAYETFVKANP